MYRLRRWSTRHARGLETLYQNFERAMAALHPLWQRIGYERLERPVAAVEKQVKGLLFDCRMCGQCSLSDTGMACPMNCPKQLRNGPCGGVRTDGNCEVIPSMRCVWVEAWEGSRRMRRGKEAIRTVLPAIDIRLAGSSSWLRAARARAQAGP
ncbi:MAG: methylenetetrahydrofolate reductase C-terminal domain-containing protein [Alphaproteobacteria bacterium]|nr:methylenetetrahydrofolate reductase C-terminal domain-containing protein [Alphaproteobacteria bacterium]